MLENLEDDNDEIWDEQVVLLVLVDHLDQKLFVHQ
jgi:hypothetical protein